MERRPERGGDKSRDSSDSRTPLAWQQRDFTFKERYPDLQAGHSSSSDRYSHPSIGSRSARSASRGARRSSERESRATNKAPSTAASRNNQPSSEETTTGSSSETESDSQAERAQRSRPGTSGTLRSVQSMPMLTPLQLHGQFNPLLGGIYGVGMVGMAPTSTWNGEPCPVHGSTLPQATPFPISVTPYPGYAPIYSSMSMRRTASIHELALATPLPASYPQQAIYATLPHQPAPSMLSMPPGGPMLMLPPPPGRPGPQFKGPSRQAGSLPPLPPPSLLPPLQRPRPLVVSEKNRQPEPLPVRDAPPLPAKVPPSDASKIPPKGAKKSKPFSYNACCRGNVIVLWAILGVIAFGIVLGVVFHFAFKPPS